MRRIILIIIAVLSYNLSLLLTSCTSTPRNRIELKFPAFPDPIVDGESIVKYDPESDTVSMPLFYWKAITSYEIDVNTLKKIYEVLDADN